MPASSPSRARLPAAGAVACRRVLHSGTSFADYRDLLKELPAREPSTSHAEQSYAHTVASTWSGLDRGGQPRSFRSPSTVLDMAALPRPRGHPQEALRAARRRPARRCRIDGGSRIAFNALARYSLATVDDTRRRGAPPAPGIDPRRRSPRIATAALATRCARSMTGVPRADRSLHRRMWSRCASSCCAHVLALADTADAAPAQRRQRVVGLLNHVMRLPQLGGAGRARAGARAHDAAASGASPRRRPPGSGLSARSRLSSALPPTPARHDEAIAHRAKRWSPTAREILGTEHPETLAARHGLAYALRDAGRVGGGDRDLRAAARRPRAHPGRRRTPTTLMHAATTSRYAYHDSGSLRAGDRDPRRRCSPTASACSAASIPAR